jgi:thioredoxin-related protein
LKRTLKIIFLLSLFLFGHTALNANPISEGKKEEKKEDKEMVVYFFSKYCEYCTKMDRDVLNDKEISGTLKREIIYLRIDVDKNTDIAKKYGVWGYPTTLLLESSGKTIAPIPGYIPKKEFKKILLYLKGKHYKTTNLSDFLKTEKTQ